MPLTSMGPFLNAPLEFREFGFSLFRGFGSHSLHLCVCVAAGMKGDRLASHAVRCLFPEACLEKTSPALPVDGESDLDYLLALSLQHENSFGQPSVAELHRELWKNICPPQTGPADHRGKAKNSRDPSQDLLVPANNLNKPKSTSVFVVSYPGISGTGMGML